MKRLLFFFYITICFHFSISGQKLRAEGYYVSAFNEMYDMLVGRDSLSIKRAVFLAEWAYYEGKLDYKTDFCDEIERISNYIRVFYDVNGLSRYKTGKQMALNEYFFSPYSGNGYKPYTYDFEEYSKSEESLEQVRS